MQVARVRQHGPRREVAKGSIPNFDQPRQHRHIRGQRFVGQMFIDDPKPSQHVAEGVGADGDHQRQADGGIHRVAAADPIPKAEHVVGVDPEVSHLIRVG